jgi:hypothetical protein
LTGSDDKAGSSVRSSRPCPMALKKPEYLLLIQTGSVHIDAQILTHSLVFYYFYSLAITFTRCPPRLARPTMCFDSDNDHDSSDHCDDPCTCRPALPRMKSCLKSSPSHSGAATPVHSDTDSASCKKHVAFCEEGTEQVFQADEWDRTPTEIAQRLSYE